MEFFAVAKEGVCIYNFQPGEEPGEPIHKFPPTSTADGCVWSQDGMLLGLVEPTGGVAVYNAAGDYQVLCQVPPLVGGPVRMFYFSPLGNHLVTYERWVKDAGPNCGVWDAKTGEMKFKFIMKKMTDMSWPPLKWTALETHCCRMVQDGVIIMPGNCSKGGEGEDGEGKINAPGIIAFEVAPKGAQGNPPHIATVVGEAKGAPARCQVFRVTDPGVPTATKTFFKAQTVTMQWNNTGTSLLVRTSQEVDDTGKSYYGGSHLYFMRADGEESCIISSPDDGAIHDVQWNPVQDEFLLISGTLPCAMTLFDGKKGAKKMDFGTGHRNTIRFNNFGRFIALGGYGQLLGDTDFWDKPGKTLLGTVRLECCVTSSWSPDGRHYLAATTAPRMRVDNKIVMYDYCGQHLCAVPFGELLLAGWRPRSRGAFQDRPPSPGREKAAAKANAKAAAEPKKQAYRPPGARGGGGLSEMLRKELGSTSASGLTSATKVFSGPSAPKVNLPPGCSAADFAPASAAGAGGSANSRADRRKKAKAAEEAKAEAEKAEKLAAALSPKAATVAPAPKATGNTFVPPPRGEEDAAPAAASADEVEKKIRALRKKLRDVAKLKEKAEKDLDPLQREKISGEADLVRQLKDLGADP